MRLQRLIEKESHVHFLLLVQKKMDKKKRTPRENSSPPKAGPALQRTILYVPLASPPARENRLPPPPTGLNFRKGFPFFVCVG